MSVKQSIKVTNAGLSPILSVAQGTGAIEYEFTVSDFDIPSGSAAVAYNIQPTGNIVSQTCSISGNTITIKPPAYYFLRGKNYMQFQASRSNEDLFSFLIEVWCAPNISQPEVIVAENPSLVSQLISDVGLLSSQLDNLLSIPSGSLSTSADAALADIKVGWDGTTYDTPGDAVRGQIKAAVKSSGINLAPNNYTSYFTDANNAPNNTMYFIRDAITSEMITNLPVYSQNGLLITYNYSATNPHGKAQMYLAQGTFFFRTEIGADSVTVWSDWVQVADTKDVENIENITQSALKATGIQLNNTNYTSHFTDANNAQNNTMYFVSSGITSEMIANLPVYSQNGLLTTYSFSATNSHGKLQTYSTGGALYYRTEEGFEETFDWSDWVQVADTKDPVSQSVNYYHTADIFTRVCCCGDSYTSGHISTDDTTVTNEDFAWPHYMSLLTGNEYINCGRSGANVLTWQTDPRGLPKAQSSGLVQAYIIGLGLNDTAQGTSRYVELGTPSDIGTENETYYGGLSKIIRELNAISENAKIFVLTMPKPSAIRQQYNEAIRTIVTTYQDTYPVYLIDLVEYEDLYSVPSITGDSIGGHYTAIGYHQFAEILRNVISDYINNHIAEFQNVHKIPYGTES